MDLVQNMVLDALEGRDRGATLGGGRQAGVFSHRVFTSQSGRKRIDVWQSKSHNWYIQLRWILEKLYT
jgi:hypothetical protein